MKQTSFLSVTAASVMMLLACGGKYCIAQSVPSCQGIWTGVMMDSSGSGSAQVEADISQSGGALTGTARLTEGGSVVVGSITGGATSCEDLKLDFGTSGQIAATLNISGVSSSGTYVRTMSISSTSSSGVIALTLQSGLKTSQVSGIYLGTALDTSQPSGTTSVLFYLLQSGDSVYVSTMWGGSHIYNGQGTIIGNKITFDIAQNNWIVGMPFIINGSATFTGTTMSGVSFTSGGAGSSQEVTAANAFTVPFIMPIWPG